LRRSTPKQPPATVSKSFKAAPSICSTAKTRLDGYRQALAEQERLLTRRQRDVENAEAEAQAWMLSWKQAIEGCWLGKGLKAPTAAEVREALPLLAELATAINERQGLADRIAKMERDQFDYAAALQATAAAAGCETGDTPPGAIARQLADRLAMAEKTGARHDDLTRQFEEALARKRRHDETCAAHAARKTQMLDALGTDTLPDAALRIDQALERKQLGQRVSQIATELCETLGVTSLEEARSRLSAAGADELDAERQELEASLETLDAEIQHLFAARTRASDALDAVGGDDAVARIEQRRRTTLEAIAEGAERYLRLSAGVIAMEQALTLYRERHSSSMMQRASEAIRTISRGRYTGLASQPNNGNELLIAIQNDGTSKQASRNVQGRALPALPGASRRRLPRICRNPRDGAVHCRRHHGNLRRLPRRGNIPPVCRHGERRPGDLPHPSSPSLRYRQVRLSGRDHPRTAGLITGLSAVFPRLRTGLAWHRRLMPVSRRHSR
jgi:uncharacterized protein YhaN